MRRADSLEEALEGASYVQENTPEDVEIKRRVFAELDRLAEPEAVLASSTSAILPLAFSEGLAGPGALPRRPPDQSALSHSGGRDHPGAVDGRARRSSAPPTLLRGAGHAPIVMKREIDGFVVNRLQGALLEEAFRLVADGFASVEDVDVALRDGLALRWSFMGPFETIDLNAPGGVRDYAERYQQIYARIFPSTQRRADWTGAGDGRDRGGAPRAPAGRRARRAAGVARPPADGARRAQEAGQKDKAVGA